jgi:DNA repair protein RadC
MYTDNNLRQRLVTKGVDAFTDSEVLSLLLSEGPTDDGLAIAEKLVLTHGSLRELARLGLAELLASMNIGERRAMRIIAAGELGRRSTRPEHRTINFSDAASVASYAQPLLRDATEEHFLVLLLDRAGQLIVERIIAKGGVSAMVVDPKVLFREALVHKASAIIICHNHPSGNLKPSEQDVAITQKLKEGARLLEISLLDHLIVSYKGFYSFAEQGLL